ncbi:MAG TPA: Ohr family peroxiredoxin [Aestuariivirga sp.]|jgi:osmotically inducible protein OsmC|nr:Ohr family peroxiredoxin [Aestuariivirga sp.]
MAIKKLYTAHVTSTGGRGQGRAVSADGMIDFKIGQPKEMGGKDDGLNPDQLFAAAYSTCLLGTIKYVSAKEKKTVPIHPDSSITAHVSFGPRSDKKGFGIAVALDISLPGVPKAVAEKIVKKAHVACAYSNAIKKNVKVTTKIV